MKKIGTLLFIFCCSLGFAQKMTYVAPEMPVDPESKLITYSGVVDVQNTNKAELYRRGQMWFQTYFKNPSEVIRERDSVSFKIVGKPRFRINNEPNENNLKTDAGLVQYTLTVACRDNKYKYTIDEITWKQASIFPIERWVEQKERYKQNNYYLWQTDSMMRKEIAPLLEKAMKAAPVKSKKDEW